MKASAQFGQSYFSAYTGEMPAMGANAAPCDVVWIADAPSLAPLGEGVNVVYIDIEEAEEWVAKGETICDAIIIAASDYERNLAVCKLLHGHPSRYLIPSIVLVPDRKAAEAAVNAGANDFCMFYDAIEELPVRLRRCLLNQELSQKIAWQLDDQRREITESHLLTERIVDALPVSLYVVDRNRRIVVWNRNREIGGQGIGRQHVIGRSVFDVFSRMPRERLQEEFDKVFETGDTLRFEPVTEVDGDKRFWRLSKIPVHLADEDETVTHVLTIGEEITEQKKMNAAILHAEKLSGIGKLASGIVHEINNPLATVAACAEALQSRLDEETAMSPQNLEDFREYLKLIQDETFRCKAITGSLLEFSGHRQGEKSPLEINYLVEQTLRLVKHHPKLRNMHLEVQCGEELPRINANEAQIKQVFIALITNACDAVEEKDGRLEIKTGIQKTSNGAWVVAEFKDNGAGIPSDILPRIFDPFFTTKPFGQGTGLGLAVCYGIISDHGGKIEVQSRVGRGTTMKLLLPQSSV